MANVLDSKKYCTLLYVQQKLTPEQIAAKTGLSLQTVYRALNKHSLLKTRRPRRY